MNQQDLLNHIDQTYRQCLETAKAKNQDYAGSNRDAFHNFSLVERMGITTTEIGILTRLCDKFARISNLIQTPAAVKTESLDDTIMDAINYLAILRAVLADKDPLSEIPKGTPITIYDH